MKTTTIAAFIAVLAPALQPASARAQSLAWDETATSSVNGYAVTVDGVRTDYGRTPVAADGTCGCGISLPFSTGKHTSIVIAYNSAGETKARPDLHHAVVSSPLAAPADYVDVTFNASAGTSYALWLRPAATNNGKYNDSLGVPFSDALSGGSPVYRINSTIGLLVNLATDARTAWRSIRLC